MAETVFVQYAGQEYDINEIKAAVKKAWTEETDKKESDIWVLSYSNPLIYVQDILHNINSNLYYVRILILKQTHKEQTPTEMLSNIPCLFLSGTFSFQLQRASKFPIHAIECILILWYS